MKNEKILKEWMEFARMDFLTAKHLYEHMYPKPLEIICYHCQQAVEKLCGKTLSFKVRLVESGAERPSKYVSEEELNVIHTEILTED